MSSKRVLIVEDHETILEVLSLIMKRRGFDVVEERDGKKAMELLENESFDIVITDLVLSSFPGVELIRNYRERNPDALIIAISGKGQVYLNEAMEAGANKALEKPFSIDDVTAAINEATVV